MNIRAVLTLGVTLASGLTVGTVNAAATKPKPKPMSVCPSFVDPSKDDRNSDTYKVGQAAEDPALDIVKTTESVKAGRLTVAIQVTKLGPSSVSDGVQYAGGFTTGGKAVELFGTISRSAPVVSAAFALRGINVNGTYASGTSKKVAFTQDLATNTVSLTASVADVEAAAGTKFGSALGAGLQSNTMGTYGVLFEPYDAAAPTKPLRLTTADCK